jgi:hypothetical protein
MKNKYIHRLFKKKIDTQVAKVDSLFEWIKTNPEDHSRDNEMLKEMEKISTLLDEYKEACQSG